MSSRVIWKKNPADRAFSGDGQGDGPGFRWRLGLGVRNPSDCHLVIRSSFNRNIVDSIHPPRSAHSYHNVFPPHRRSRRPRSRTAPYPGRIARPASQPGQNFQRRQRQACRRRRTRPSPRGELRGVHRQVSLFGVPVSTIASRLCRSEAFGHQQSLPDLRSHASLLPRTSTQTAQCMSIADVHL